jgi:hypothetical protein
MSLSGINRTYYPKFTTYTGDGAGRDQYVVFNNGGFNSQRCYGSVGSSAAFNMAKNGYLHGVTPRKEETAFDYVPDGNGRDSYIIFNYGLKRNYKDPGKEFTSWLRKEDHTPRMDAR